VHHWMLWRSAVQALGHRHCVWSAGYKPFLDVKLKFKIQSTTPTLLIPVTTVVKAQGVV